MRAQQKILDELQQDRLSTPTGMIHHYARPDGMKKITRFGTLWLSDYTRLVDTSEIAYGFNIGMEVLRQEYEESAKTSRLRRFVDYAALIAREGLGTYFRGYILSFSTREDNLDHWREFGHRERGYCLSFDGPTLDKAFVEFTGSDGLASGGSFEVLYDEARLRHLMRQYVLNAFAEVIFLNESVERNACKEAFREVTVNLLYAFIYTALFFKYPGYETEGEYRYLLATHPRDNVTGLRKRLGKNNEEIGYFAMDWKTSYSDALREIWIGPAVAEDYGQEVVRKALARARLPGVTIRKSRFPPTRR